MAGALEHGRAAPGQLREIVRIGAPRVNLGRLWQVLSLPSPGAGQEHSAPFDCHSPGAAIEHLCSTGAARPDGASAAPLTASRTGGPLPRKPSG